MANTYLGAGNDVFDGATVTPGQAETLYGGGGADTLYGGADGPSGGERDTLFGGADADLLYGGANHDVLAGDLGNDVLFGGYGNDTLSGGGDNDRIHGDAGDDSASGGTGLDTIWGDAGNDRADGGDGIDVLYGGDGNDAMSGGAGVDGLWGGAGNDTLSGGSDGDLLYGEDGNDLLLGEAGDDEAWGAAGNDTLDGGTGDDFLSGDFGDDRLSGGGDNDRLDGGDGNDQAVGGAGDDDLDGGAGNDTLYGGTGSDTAWGGAGNDTLSGDTEADLLYGGAGNDRLIGDAGDDVFYGGAGNDVIYGGAGIDTAYFDVSMADATIYGSFGASSTVTVVSGEGDRDTLYNVEYGSFDERNAEIGGDTWAQFFEDSGTTVLTGDLDVTDPNPGEDHFIGTVISGTLGTLTIDINGEWTVAIDNESSLVQALHQDVGAHETLTVTSADGTPIEIFVNVYGTEDTADISGDTTGWVQEDSIYGASGDLDNADPDTGDSLFQSGSVSGSYGDFTVDTGGTWSYTLDNASDIVQALGGDDSVVDSFTVLAADGTETEIDITVHGQDDEPTLGGDSIRSVFEDDTTVAYGSLTADDIDAGESGFQASDLTGATYGDWAIDADGNWTYILDNASDAVQELDDLDTLTDTFTVLTKDGTPQDVTILIYGADEPDNTPASIYGDTAGEVTEDLATGTDGTLTVDDPDAGDATFQSESGASDLGLGNWTIETSGEWRYELNNSLVQHLGQGDSIVDSFTVTSGDGTETDVDITIYGNNDTPDISGNTNEFVYEDSGSEASGLLNAMDPDDGESVWQAVSGGSASYGTYAIDSDGNWSYSLDSSNVSVQGQGDGDSLFDTFTVTSADGTTQDVTIEIFGENDEPTINGVTIGQVSEDGTTETSASLSVTDDDFGESEWQPLVDAPGTYGTWNIDSSGNWTYALDNEDPAVQGLVNTTTLEDSITVTTADGTEQGITVTINGADDSASVGGLTPFDLSGDVFVFGGHSDSGSLTIVDPDVGQDVFAEIFGGSSYGNYHVAPDGSWSYEVDPGNEAVQSIAQTYGSSLEDTFTAFSDDGTAQIDIVVTIHGPAFADFISPDSGPDWFDPNEVYNYFPNG